MQAVNLSLLAAETASQTHTELNPLEQHYTKGISLLQQAMRSQFEDKDALIDAYRSFRQMISLEAQDYRPYLMTGYLLLLMDSYAEAETCLLRARELNQNAPDVNLLLETVASKRQLPAFRDWTPGVPRIDQSIDMHYFKGECEALIQAQFRRLMELPRPATSLVLESADLAIMKKTLGLVSQTIVILQEALLVLSEAYSAKELEALLKPLLNLQSHYQTYYQQSECAARIKRKLGAGMHAAQHLSQRIGKLSCSADFTSFVADLDELCDSCDAHADQIDALSSSGLDTRPLEKSYERLIASISQIQQSASVQRRRLVKTRGTGALRV